MAGSLGRKSELARPPTRFIGRVAERETLRALFTEGRRLVTLWGPGGMGKTRLALEFARTEQAALAHEDGGGVWFCPLAEARDLAAVCGALSRCLGVLVTAGGKSSSLVKKLGALLASRGPALLVLDNVEQALTAVTPAVEAWMRAAPEVRFLLTSRERTRLPGEVSYELSPLGLPGAKGEPRDSEAVQLFLDRVREQRPSAPLGDARLAEVATLVRELEGIPLAIELAAARFEVLGLEGLLAHLTDRLGLLSPRARGGGDARQSTLRGAIEWSWDLLLPREQEALARCSVFRGGFSLDAARDVLAAKPAEALDLVEALRDKSLLRVATPEDGAPAPGSEQSSTDAPSSLPPTAPRFSLAAGLREFAAEKLASRGEVELAERLHADHYVAVGEPWAAELERSGRTAPLDAIARELENLLAVVERVLARRDGKRASADVALRALLVIDPVLTTRGPFGAHLELLDRALAAGERGGSSPALLARALGARGRARHVRGLVEAGLSDLDRAYALAHKIGDLRAESSFLADLGILHRQEHGRALGLYERALALSREASDLRGEARALGNLGTLHHDLKDFPQAIRHYQRALALAAEVGDLRLDGIVNMNLAILEQERGAAAGARTRYERAIRCLVEVGDLRLLAIALGNLGLLHHEEGRLEEARASGERAARLLRQVGDRRSEAISLGRLGAALASLDRADEAMAALERGERLLEGLGDRLALEGVRLGHAFADSAAARRALVEKREGEALAHLEAARLKMAALTAPGPAGSPSQADRSDDIRASLRILERSLAAIGGAADAQSSDALLLAPEARWFRPPKGAWVDLRTRHQARRVVAKLVEKHRAEPGRGLPLAALLAAGWPGERVLESAGANRLYVLLNQLRKLGLREHLTRTEEGYLLEPRLKIHYVSVEPA